MKCTQVRIGRPTALRQAPAGRIAADLPSAVAQARPQRQRCVETRSRPRFLRPDCSKWATTSSMTRARSAYTRTGSREVRARIGNDNLGRECFHETASACHQTSRRTTAGSGGRGHARRPRLTGESPSEPRSRPRLSAGSNEAKIASVARRWFTRVVPLGGTSGRERIGRSLRIARYRAQ